MRERLHSLDLILEEWNAWPSVPSSKGLCLCILTSSHVLRKYPFEFRVIRIDVICKTMEKQHSYTLEPMHVTIPPNDDDVHITDLSEDTLKVGGIPGILSWITAHNQPVFPVHGVIWDYLHLLEGEIKTNLHQREFSLRLCVTGLLSARRNIRKIGIPGEHSV